MTKYTQRLPADITLERYTCVCLSTGHLTEDAVDELKDAVGNGMVMSRDSGWFVKFYAEWECNCWCDSPDLRSIMFWAWSQGFGMIEFDADAQTVDMFKTF